MKTVAILLAILFQVSVLLGMLVSAALPLWTGTEILLKTAPVDPRSLFRGNYARLRYDISQVSSGTLSTDDLRHGEIVYVSLEENELGIHEYAGLSLEPPPTGPFIRGRYQGQRWRDPDDANSVQLNIHYGIEAYFAPIDKALELEERLRESGAVASVMISDQGKAALQSIE